MYAPTSSSAPAVELRRGRAVLPPRTEIAVHAAWLEPAEAAGTSRLRLEFVAQRELQITAVETAVAGRIVLDESAGPLATHRGRLATCLATGGMIRFEALRRPLRHGERVTCTVHFADGSACRIDCTTREDWLRAPRPREPRVRLCSSPGRLSA